MKTLMLIRHGAAQIQSGLNDFDRPLTTSGVENSLSLGQFILESKNIPDLIISSTAKRAKGTAENIIKGGKLGSDLLFEDSIYGGNSSFLLYLLSEQKNSYNNICLVGHEPHFSNFIYNITNKKNFIFETANLVIIKLNIKKWENVNYKKGRILLIIKPNELKL